MIKRGKKAVSLTTVILLLLLNFVPAVSAVTYPQGITAQQMTATIDKTDIIIETLLKSTKEGSLENLIFPQLFKDEVLSSLTVGIYSGIEENAEGISALGLDLSTKGVAKHLGDYSDVKEKLESFNKWSEANLDGASWGVSDKDSFIKATASVLAPFNELLYTLLCAGTYSINAVIGFEGDKGYEKSIIPALKALGCETITDSEVFYAMAKESKNSMLENILSDIFTLAERVTESPCNVLSEILPGIAYFLNDGGLDKAVASLIEPVRLQLFNISTFIKVETILSFIQNSEFYTQSFTLSFNDILSDTGLKMAEIDLEELSECGTANSDGTLVSDKAAAFTVLMRWVIDTAKLNKDSLSDIMSEDTAEMADLIDKLLAQDTDKLIAKLVGLLNMQQSNINDYAWTFSDFEAANVIYTPNLTRDKYQRVVDGIDDLINQFIAENGKNETAREALAPQIYSNKLVSTLACGIYGALAGEDLKMLASAAGLDVTPAALANELKEARFANTRYALSRVSKWEKVNVNTLTWGFRNGDKDGFVKALCAVLRPMEDVITMLLCEGKIQIMGAVDIYGSNGYNTAVIPLLEALGCDKNSILTYEEYKKAAEKGKATESLINAVLSLVERFLDRPVYTVTEILPNLLYFINNGGIETCIDNLIYPFTLILKDLGMEDMLKMPEMSEIDIESMAADMMKGNNMGFDLSSFDIQQFAGMGELVTVESKRTQGGEAVTVSYLKADQPAIMVTLLRFIAQMMKTPGNENMMMGFMGSGDNDMFSNFSGGIGDEMTKMSVDETVEWLYKIFFRERAVVEIKPQEDYLPTIIYTPEKSIDDAVPVLTGFLFIAAVEVLIVFNRKRINYYLDARRKNKSATNPQEV